MSTHQYRSLLTRKVSPFSFATVPSYDAATLHVPNDFNEPDVLSRPVNYAHWLPIEGSVSLANEGPAPTLLELRNLAVAKAKEAGMLNGMTVPDDFMLMIKGEEVVIPAKDFPTCVRTAALALPPPRPCVTR